MNYPRKDHRRVLCFLPIILYKLSTENLGFRRVRSLMIQGVFLGSNDYPVRGISGDFHPVYQRISHFIDPAFTLNRRYSSQLSPLY
jgi:hypothetical protein